MPRTNPAQAGSGQKRGAADISADSEAIPRRGRASKSNINKKVDTIGESALGQAQPSVDASEADEIISQLVDISPLPRQSQSFEILSKAELKELERVLEFEATGESWRDDWTGNLALIDKEIRNPKDKSREKSPFRQTLLEWAYKDPDNAKYILHVIRFVLAKEETPIAVKRILTNVYSREPAYLEKQIRLTSYHPQVLRDDGWTTKKSTDSQPPIGGPYLIGDRVRWEHSDGVVIAYVRDPDIGDLWKALSVDRDDLHTFDLEAEEVLDAKQKFERRQQQTYQSRRSTRFAGSSDFCVDGLGLGIVLAASYSKGARPGVYWPARVVHASETNFTAGKRSSSKQKVDVIFLSPYWNADDSTRKNRVESLSENAQSSFDASPLLQIETIDASEEMIRPYNYEGLESIDMDVLRTFFGFTGLPKAVFGRFVNSHRLALALRKYAMNYIDTEVTATERATAGLFECHPMTVQAPVFPRIVLELPLAFIVAQLPHPRVDSHSIFSDNPSSPEPIVDLNFIVESMMPPACFGLPRNGNGNITPPQKVARAERIQTTPGTWMACMQGDGATKTAEISSEDFFQGLWSLNEFFARNTDMPAIASLQRTVFDLIETVRKYKEHESNSIEKRDNVLKKDDNAVTIYENWVLLKTYGEEVIGSIALDLKLTASADWRRALERLYKYLVSKSPGRNATVVLSDLRCNGHLTGEACFERSVRLPAALKAARLAGATADGPLRLILGVEDEHIKLAEWRILPKAHTTSYLKRMKSRCESAPSPESIIMLTDDSDEKGGEDTMGSKGTWSAAVCGVAAALKVTKMVVHGETVNGFCVSRPPGHHAGRSLHPMKAISNGFCILNTAACAAIYATSPISEGGLGLSRVCVIDADAHHGNGTQDILCSTYDPRFLYISMHAGGAEVNGAPSLDQDDPNNELHNLPSNPKSGGIYPGRCGDTSPHKGVLNIPLGARVTPHDVGTALVQHVTPAVDNFSPDLIILSAGFDAHKNDPMGLGALSAKDFGHITEVVCALAFKSCSGRVVSVLEGGYGVPCCRPQRAEVYCLPVVAPTADAASASGTALEPTQQSRDRPQPASLLDLGEDLPDSMDDQVPYALQRRLEKCHAEGFVECVKEHVAALAKCAE
ncbi:hypothetical protein MPSEU_000814900 [Mayamaea pseudoterrestris]|nr:hypothetical protein MPSEU_000814900 [Mayamaea pseudoterrestris]